MAQNDRLRIKRGDTAEPFRAQCRKGDGTPANLTGASARMLLSGSVTGPRSLALTVEAGTDGWVRHQWAAGETAVAETALGEAEITYANGTVQTFPGGGYFTLEILEDLG